MYVVATIGLIQPQLFTYLFSSVFAQLILPFGFDSQDLVALLGTLFNITCIAGSIVGAFIVYKVQ